jgi:hypothetical protein
MSDFLTNLVARNLEPATEIKPRLASLYETPQPVGGILYGPTPGPVIRPESPEERGLQETLETLDAAPFNPAEHVWTERLLRAQSLERNHATRQFPSRRQPYDASDASTPDLLPETSQPPSSSISHASAVQWIGWSNNQQAQAPAKPPSDETSSQARSGPESSKLIPATASDEAHSGHAVRSSSVDERDASAKVAPAQGRVPSPTLPPGDARQRGRAMEAEHSSSQDESDALDHRSAGHEARPALTRPLISHLPGQDVATRDETRAPAGVFIRPQVTHKNEPDAPAPVAAPPLTAPTINVTIGRIEVRAAASTESRTRPQHKQTPTTSLDEYLRQRAQGVKR